MSEINAISKSLSPSHQASEKIIALEGKGLQDLEGRRDEGDEQDDEGEQPKQPPPAVEGDLPVNDGRVFDTEHDHEDPPECPSLPEKETEEDK